MSKEYELFIQRMCAFPTDVCENRRHIHVIRRGNKKSQRGNTVAKIWIEKEDNKKIEIEK